MGTLRDEAAVGGPCPAYGFLSQFALQRSGRIRWLGQAMM